MHNIGQDPEQQLGRVIMKLNLSDDLSKNRSGDIQILSSCELVLHINKLEFPRLSQCVYSANRHQSS